MASTASTSEEAQESHKPADGDHKKRREGGGILA